MNINYILQDIISSLNSLKPIPQPKSKSPTFVPLHKLESFNQNLKNNLKIFFIDFLQNIKSAHSKYNSVYQENVIKRNEYVKNTLENIKNEIDSPETLKLKSIKSKIDFIKSQNFDKIQQIKINKEDTIKIFRFLNKLELNEEYEWMEDFLKRKIIFEFDSPSELEVINLRKMINLLQNTNK
ncbi:uncharacterized protein VNE69_12011 [Vairimorpha necatrix]|uniref:Uncharacterized protein n=1 Tax=Vairimorpha necatrix TaxID=6039 RepID=A0AAX4JGF2_9MICR